MAGELTFTPSEKDYADANRDSMLSQLRRPRPWIALVLSVLFSAGIGAGVTWLDGNPEEIELTALGFALLGLFVFLFIYLATYMLLPRRTRRLYRQHKTLQQPWTYGWSEAGLSVHTANGHTLHPWPDFHRWLVGRRMVLLFVNDQLFFLPRRLLDDSAVEELRSFVAAGSVPRV